MKAMLQMASENVDAVDTLAAPRLPQHTRALENAVATIDEAAGRLAIGSGGDPRLLAASRISGGVCEVLLALAKQDDAMLLGAAARRQTATCELAVMYDLPLLEGFLELRQKQPDMRKVLECARQ